MESNQQFYRPTQLIRATAIMLSLGFIHLHAQQTAIAVLDFDGYGISDAEAIALSNRLRNELFRLGRFEVVDRGMMETILNEQDFQQLGCTSNDCLVEVGKMVGASQMVGGSISKVGGTFTVSARLVDVETGKVLGVSDFDIKGELDDLLTRGMAQVAAMLSMGEGEIELPTVAAVEDTTPTPVVADTAPQPESLPPVVPAPVTQAPPSSRPEVNEWWDIPALHAISPDGYVLGWDRVTLVGRLHRDDDGNIKSVLGVSAGLGVGYKQYLRPGAQIGQINGYFAVGTDIVVLPFIGIGVEYIFDLPTKFHIGFNITLDIVNPVIPATFFNIGVYQ
ncbi:MAG: DUF2380 domain-containing protein [Candidatus Neomarinimicrobiota bacterium]